MKVLLLVIALLTLHGLVVGAANRLPLSHRTNLAQRPLTEAPKQSTDHMWKIGLLGLAGLGFLIRKRL